MMKRDDRVDHYIQTLPVWQQVICLRARELIHEVDPEIEETIKRRILPYFVLQGNICAFMGTKDHVNIFIYDPIASDPQGIINQGEANSTARSIQIYEDNTLNESAFSQLIREVVANNKAGGWRKLAK